MGTKEQLLNIAMTVNQHSKEFELFLLKTHQGFEKGAREHGEGSNEKMQLIDEMMNELRDFACYAFFQFKKLVKLKEALDASGIDSTGSKS